MDILGIDISKAKFDVTLIVGDGIRHSTHSNKEAGFEQMLAWLAKHRPDQAEPLHACMEATGNYGIDLADFLFSHGFRVSIVNPARVKAFAASVGPQQDGQARCGVDRAVLSCARPAYVDTACGPPTRTSRTGSSM